MISKIESIKKHGRRAKGRTELLKHLSGEKLTRPQAVVAKCYECMGYYADGVKSCTDSQCPLYPFNFYAGDSQKRGF